MKNQGFTLIELLITIAVIGILSAIAVPSYSSYIAKSRVTTAQSDLVLLSLRYENLYQRVLAYPTTAGGNKSQLQSIVSGWSPASEDVDFDFTSINATTTSYTLQATGKKGSYSGCVISLTHDGTKSISDCASLAPDSKWL